MRPLIFSIALLTFCLPGLYAQQTLNYGEVRTDSNFNCNGAQNYFGLKSLCDSKNDLEIRLSEFFPPHGGHRLIVLTNNNGDWDVKKYSSRRSSMGNEINSTSIELDDKRFTYPHFQSIFDSLKQNDIFLLPNQQDLKVDFLVFDGAIYSLAFKAGNSLRSYGFDNPDIYEAQYPLMIEFRKYQSIVRFLEDFFK